MALTNEQILAIQANRRTRLDSEVYAEKFAEFLESDDAAVDIAEQWPTTFRSKKASTIAVQFGKLVKAAELKGTIDIVLRDGHVFMLHNERVELLDLDAA